MYAKHKKDRFFSYPQNLLRTSNPQRLIPQNMFFLTARPQILILH